MRLTVLGSSASYAGPGQACSGHLIEADGVRVQFDIGNGTLANLGKVSDPLQLDAVFVTHLHPDHFLDLFALQSALRYAPEGPAPPVRVYGPEGLFDRAKCLLSGQGKLDFDAAFVTDTLSEGSPVQVGSLTVTPQHVEHEGETFALIADVDGGRLCYTSDTRRGDAVRRAAEGADVLVAEATMPAEYAGRAPHMTGAEAGQVAADAGAHTLILSHLWPTASRRDILGDARAVFGGTVLLAEELLTVDV